jgi:hypothetical protein
MYHSLRRTHTQVVAVFTWRLNDNVQKDTVRGEPKFVYYCRSRSKISISSEE